MKLLYVLVLLTSTHSTNSQGSLNPAVKVHLSEKALNYAANIVAEKIARDVQKSKIDDISGKKGVKYSLRNIKVENFRKPDSQILIIPGNGIHLRLLNGALAVSSRWKFRKAFIRDSGSVTASVDPINIELSVNVVADSNGRPSLTSHSCAVQLEGLKVKLRGGASVLYNLILKAFKDKIEETIKKNICNAATDAINIKGNQQLATMNLQAKVSNGLVLDCHLTAPPVFAGTRLETSHKGLFLEDPNTPQIPLMGNAADAMVGFSVAEEAFNSAARVAFTKNLLNREFEVPPIKDLLSLLDPKFSNVKPIVKVTPSLAPTVVITQGLLSINAQGRAELFGLTPDGVSMPVVSVDLNLTALTTVAIVEEKIVIQVTQIVPKAEVNLTNSVTVPPAFLKSFLEQSIIFALPAINNNLKIGFPLPNVKKVKFSNAAINLQPGYLTVSTDVLYQSSTS